MALQSATVQDGGREKTTNRHSRILRYSRSGKHSKGKKSSWTLTGEYVVALPQYVDPTRPAAQNPRTAAQSALHALSNTVVLILSRDGDAGQGLDLTESQYRQIDILDTTKATNILGIYDGVAGSISPNGVLKPGIRPVDYCPFISINDNSELAKFGLHNGGAQDSSLLGEKWEAISVVPSLDDSKGKHSHGRKEYFVFAAGDNDFMTQNGYFAGGKYRYSEEGGVNLDNMILVYKIMF